ncbi:MAG TPA: type II toxin-antitoxin system HicB family antitoxin [Niabella sp.]|nr:type II toxin-antitoxin system HicB family antitoxin [Niabella sp.]
MSEKKVSISLTGIIIKDNENKGYTAYFAEFPEAIADGKEISDAETNLIEAFKVMLETRKLESYPDDKANGGIIQQNFEFELA